MTTANFTEILERIQPDLNQVKGQASKEAVFTLLNMVEESVAETIKLKDENQTLKDEINRLKGEQGKPNIRPNKKKNDGDVSSEKERNSAENNDEVKREGFKLDKGSLGKLKEQRLSAELLDQLSKLDGEKYSDEEGFLTAVESLLEQPLTEEEHRLLLKYARYKKRNRKAKLPEISIDRREQCPVDKTLLPDDAKSKGHEFKVVQDVIIKTDNVEFQREVYHSPSLKKTYLGPIPLGYEGDFGPHIHSDIVSMKYVNGMSIPKIIEFYNNMGILISGSYISNRLIKPAYMDVFHQEKEEMHKVGLEVSSYIQIDDTGTRVNGQNYYTQIICNDLYTAFFTTKRKNRLTVLDVLRNFESRSFLLNDETLLLLDQLVISKKDLSLLSAYKQNTPYDEDEMQTILQTLYGTGSPRKRTKIMEACAITSYRQETGIAVVKVLVCDDAPQFKLLTDELALCWIHIGRHYKRLNPVVPLHQEQLNDFLRCFWEYYHKLAAYKKNPSSNQSKLLIKEFDVLFSTKTGYDDLDNRIEKNKTQKEELLVVLKHPEVPLHNNLSENGARVEKRRQDVSLQTKTDEGTKAKDTMMSIIETCKKLGISGYKFIHDRVTKKFRMPSLAEMIKAKAAGQPISP